MRDERAGADPGLRRAGLIAALIALPVALGAGIAVAFTIGGSDAGPTDSASPDVAGGPDTPPGPVDMAAPALDTATATTCRTLVAGLPAEVRGRPRRPVAVGAEQNAAYGTPPITLGCGTLAPTLPDEADIYLLSGVCWYARGTQWITVDRQVTVTMAVPADYAPPGQWVIDFSAPIAASIPTRPDAPPGCQLASPERTP